MNRILSIILVMLFPLAALAQDRYDIPQTGTKVGLTRAGINSNFTFLFIAGTNAFRTAVEKNSNINYIAKSPTNPTQLDYVLTNITAAAGGGGGATTNVIALLGIDIADAYTFTNQYSVRGGGARFPTNISLVEWWMLGDGGTQTVDLIVWTPGAAQGTYTTNTAGLLVVGYTSVVPSAALTASNSLGIRLRGGGTITNLWGGVGGRL